MTSPTKIWLDCDPGRDDAIAILLALHLPQIKLLGLSAVHGNSATPAMVYNCVRLLCSFTSAEEAESIPVATGAYNPLVNPFISVAGVHGADGLGGVEGLLTKEDKLVAKKLEEAASLNAIDAMREAMLALPQGEKLTLVATGAFTNVALLVSVYPDLVLAKVNEIVVMGGAEGRGNKSPVAEANVLCDPHAASIVFNFPLRVVLAPLNLTHSALFHHETHCRLLDPSAPITEPPTLPKPTTTLRHCLSSDLTFFALAYKNKYNFPAPPCHDALTIAYLSHPHFFEGKRYRVDVELAGTFCSGASVVDLWDYRQLGDEERGWGREGKNCFILEKVDVDGFWNLFLEIVEKADKVARINQQ